MPNYRSLQDTQKSKLYRFITSQTDYTNLKRSCEIKPIDYILGSPKSPIGNQVKQLLIIYLSPFIYPRKNLLLVSFLLLILSFTGCKSVVEEPVIEVPVVEELDITQKTVSLEVWYFGIRNGLDAWYDEKQEGVKSEDNKDVSKYSGEFKHGQGAFTWSDGTKYVGSWKDGMMNGQGTMTFGRG